MNVLILTCNTGGGHNGAARAIAEELESRGIKHHIENALSFTTKLEEDMIVGGYAFMYKYTPGVWDAAYHAAEGNSSDLLYLYYAKNAPALKSYIKKRGFDAVVSVHVFPALMMTRIRRKNELPGVKQYFVATDYTCSPGYDKALMDRCFIPKGLSRECALGGMDKDSLMEVGIPVRPACYEPMTREYAREQLASDVKMSPEDKVVLIAPNTVESSEMKQLIQHTLADVPEARFVVICGKGNGSLKSKLTRMNNDRVTALTYTTRMDLWMKAADVLITKPGGLTSTEAVTCRVPVILLDVLGGLETYNRDHYVNRGCASTVACYPALYGELVRLLLDDEAREEMMAAQKKHFGTNAVKELVDEMVRQAEEQAAQALESGEEKAEEAV